LYFSDVLTAPPAQTFTWFDFTLNAFSYFPLGFLLAYLLRNRCSGVQLVLLATLAGLSLSLLMEYAQMYLPSRVSSNSDLLSNSLGTLTGASVALLIAQYSWYSRIEIWHDKWFKHDRIVDFGLALLALWVFAQTNPSLPMLGSVVCARSSALAFRYRAASTFQLAGVRRGCTQFAAAGHIAFNYLRERRHMINALLLLLCGVTLIKFIAAAVLLKSWALLLWLNSEALFGIIAGLLLLTVATRLSYKWLPGFSAAAAILYLILLQDLLAESPKLCRFAPVSLALYPHASTITGYRNLPFCCFPCCCSAIYGV